MLHGEFRFSWIFIRVKSESVVRQHGLLLYQQKVITVSVMLLKLFLVLVQVTVTQSDLQWAPENAICNGYDFMQLFDGEFSSRSNLNQVCDT